MKKEYKSTIEEAVQANFRLAELVGTVSKQKWLGFILIPFIFLVLYGILPTSQFGKVMFAGLFSIIFIPVHLLTYEIQIRKRIRKALVKIQGTDKPVPCEYEIDETGLTFRKMGQDLRFSWSNVRDLNDVSDFIEVIMEPTGIAIVPKRIFDEPAELQEWIEVIKDHIEMDRREAP